MQIIMYIGSGIITTITNFACYVLCNCFFSPTVSTSIAWFVSVGVSFSLNDNFVFKSCNVERKKQVTNLCKFFVSRLFSGVIEIFLVFIFVEKLLFYDMLVKVIVCIIVILMNYFIGKNLIFK